MRDVFNSLLACTAACSIGCGGATVPSRAWTAQFTGVIRDVSGAPVPNARVTIQGIELNGSNLAVRGKCTGGTVNLPAGTADAAGRYVLTMNGGGPPLFACVFVEASHTMAGQSKSGVVERDSIVIGPTGRVEVETDVTIRP